MAQEQMQSSPPLLEVDHVTVRFGGVRAICEVSFAVWPGELLGLIGPNGAGKTTILRAITGVVQQQEGAIRLAGTTLDRLPIDRRIRLGMALSQQLVRPFREISVVENVMLAAGYRKTMSPLTSLFSLTSHKERSAALALLDRVGIVAYADDHPGTQPLGVLKRLEVARALALDPRLLLLDEPLAGLNSKEAAELATTIAEINRQGITVVMIEHNLGEVLRVCQRLVVLDNGCKIAEGEPRTIMHLPVVRVAYLGGTADTAEEPRR